MKLEALSIRNFRAIESLDLSFKDDLGLVVIAYLLSVRIRPERRQFLTR